MAFQMHETTRQSATAPVAALLWPTVEMTHYGLALCIAAPANTEAKRPHGSPKTRSVQSSVVLRAVTSNGGNSEAMHAKGNPCPIYAPKSMSHHAVWHTPWSDQLGPEPIAIHGFRPILDLGQEELLAIRMWVQCRTSGCV